MSTSSSLKPSKWQELERSLANVPDLTYQHQVNAKTLTTVAIGGPLHLLATVHTEKALSNLHSICESLQIPLVALGFGSNSLFPDETPEVCVFRLGTGFREFSEEKSGHFSVGAGVGLMSFSRKTASAGYSGLEFAGGIPGTIGGALWMNAGAHGSEICESVISTRCMMPDGELVTLKADELSFQYRSCGLPLGSIFLSTVIKLVAGDPQQIMSERTRCLDYRKETQPLTLPSFGSVFRNPEGHFAGKLLEQVGCKSLKIGGAEFSSLHANWIVNPTRSASYHDVKSLLSEATTRVKEKFNLTLVSEVVDWGG